MRFRNNVIGTYLGPLDAIELLPPSNKYFGVSRIQLTGGVSPAFAWFTKNGEINFYTKAWLHASWDKNPEWTISHGGDGKSDEMRKVPFDDPRAKLAVDLVRHLCAYFPFPPTDNWMQNEGKCIA